MNKYIIVPIVFALAIAGVSQHVFVVHAEEGDATVPSVAGSNASEGGPVTGGSNAPEASGTVPNNTGTGTNESGQIIPNTGGTGSNESGAIVPNTGGSNTDEGTLPAQNNTPNGGGTVTGGGSTPVGGGSSINSGGSAAGLNAGVVFTPASCPLITDYLKFGGANNAAQVTKLQAFLKTVEKLDVDVNGIFDQKTQNAVIAFQTKYATSILGPWSASQASGFVYITTMKTINQIACAARFTLSANEQAIIDAYKANRDQTASVQVGQENGSTTPVNGGTLEIGSNEQPGDENVAAVGQSSILSRFWNFIKELFQ